MRAGAGAHGREVPLWPFLLLSLALFAAGSILIAAIIHPEAPLKIVEVDLSDIQGVNKEEPPPSGEPDASPAPSSTPAPAPAATPEPTPESTPAPPMPQATPEFVEPAPSAPPAASPKPHRKQAARSAVKRATAPVPQSIPGNMRGSPTGKAGARGGSKGDFTSTPHPEYDAVALQRGYQGSGTVLILYSDGKIVSVEMSRSTGVSYLDSRIVSWVKNYWKVRPGASGRATLPITWRIE